MNVRLSQLHFTADGEQDFASQCLQNITLCVPPAEICQQIQGRATAKHLLYATVSAPGGAIGKGRWYQKGPDTSVIARLQMADQQLCSTTGEEAMPNISSLSPFGVWLKNRGHCIFKCKANNESKVHKRWKICLFWWHYTDNIPSFLQSNSVNETHEF